MDVQIEEYSEGRIERYKTRFCAKGFTQVEGIDFTQTFVPVAKMNSICVILSIATTHDLELQQSDVDTAFLYGDVKQNRNLHETADGICRARESTFGMQVEEDLSRQSGCHSVGKESNISPTYLTH